MALASHQRAILTWTLRGFPPITPRHMKKSTISSLTTQPTEKEEDDHPCFTHRCNRIEENLEVAATCEESLFEGQPNAIASIRYHGDDQCPTRAAQPPRSKRSNPDSPGLTASYREEVPPITGTDDRPFTPRMTQGGSPATPGRITSQYRGSPVQSKHDPSGGPGERAGSDCSRRSRRKQRIPVITEITVIRGRITIITGRLQQSSQGDHRIPPSQGGYSHYMLDNQARVNQPIKGRIQPSSSKGGSPVTKGFNVQHRADHRPSHGDTSPAQVAINQSIKEDHRSQREGPSPSPENTRDGPSASQGDHQCITGGSQSHTGYHQSIRGRSPIIREDHIHEGPITSPSQ
ncbi:unnamed protein product, partial [Pleuronectes platessa]